MACTKCGSTNIVKNGRTATRQQQYHGRACGVYTVMHDRTRDCALKRELVETLYRERVAQRGIARVTGISRPTIVRRLRKKYSAPLGRRSCQPRPDRRLKSTNTGRMWTARARSSGTRSPSNGARSVWLDGPLAIDPPRPAGGCGSRCLPTIASAVFFIPTRILSIGRCCPRRGTVRVRKGMGRPVRWITRTTRFASGAPIWCGTRCHSVEIGSCMRCASVWSWMLRMQRV